MNLIFIKWSLNPSENGDVICELGEDRRLLSNEECFALEFNEYNIDQFRNGVDGCDKDPPYIIRKMFETTIFQIRAIIVDDCSIIE